ncbi:MAG: thiol reductant ABC exporter subunit CydD [Anaerolineae bacterium]
MTLRGRKTETSIEQRVLQADGRGRARLYAAVLLMFLAAALLVAQTWLLSVAVSRVFLGGEGLHAVMPLLALMAALLVLRAALVWGAEVVGQRAASHVKGSLRLRLTQHLFDLGPSHVRNERSGELVNTLVEGIEALDEYITQYQPARLLSVFVPVLILLVILVLDPWTTLVLLFAAPMLLILLALIGGRTRELSQRRFSEMSWMSGHFLDMLQGLTTLKMFGRSKEQAETIEDISRHFGATTMDVLRTAFQTSLVLEWSAVAATAFVAVEVSFRLMNGVLPFDRALAVLILTPEFFLPWRQLALKYHAGTAGKAAAERVFAVLDTPLPSPTMSASPNMPRRALPTRFDIEMLDVRFAYDGGARPALQGLDLSVSHGQTVALVGPSGAGKTTVANLLLRFIEPDTGVITVGGTPLRDVERAAWRDCVGWVPQHPHLFHGSVAENLRLARPSATQAEVEAAARAAHADEFILALPRGYDTPIHERGVRLSGGQRQRIAIARAFLKDAPLLVMDEPTSHLDVESEVLIRDALMRLMRGRTVLVIAHRLEMAYQADQIVVLDRGRAVARGGHDALLAEDGLYRTLVATYVGATT